jgi:pimeloyl-ACP methyl ester carboxylesterase
MLARLQRFITLGFLAIALAWALVWAPSHTGIALLGVVLLFAGHSIFLAFEYVLMRRANRADPAPAATLTQVVLAWLRECLMAPLIFYWRQPFREYAVPDRLVAGKQRDRNFADHGDAAGLNGKPALPGVVLVHGLVCNRAFWTPWLRALAARGQPFIAVNLEPVFGEIDGYVPALDDAVRRMAAATGTAPVLVCHSMGGIVARAWLDKAGDDSRVARVLTLGSPHHGTRLADLSHTPNGMQMRVGSDWLARLASREMPARRRLFTCWYSNCDNIVFPASTAKLPDADNRLVQGQPHVGMAFDAKVMDEALALIANPSVL